MTIRTGWQWVATWLTDLRDDVRYAARQFRRSPAPVAFVVVSLAIGIGANVTMGAILDRLMLRPPPDLRDAARVARLVAATPQVSATSSLFSYPELLSLRNSTSVFEDVAAVTFRRVRLGHSSTAHDATVALVSANYFTLLGPTMALGRAFAPTDGFPTAAGAGGPPLAVISFGLWASEFGSNRAVLGRAVQIGEQVFTIVGVASREFRGIGPEGSPDLWLPLPVTANTILRPGVLEDATGSLFALAARLRGNVSLDAAGKQATNAIRQYLPPAGPFSKTRALAVSTVPGRGPDAPKEAKIALWLGAISLLVLAIACANVSNLLLGRALTRQHEIAVRFALGADTGRIARQVAAEAVLLAIVSGGAAVWLAKLAGGAARSLFGLPDPEMPFIDGRVFCFAIVVALVTALGVSLGSLIRAHRADFTPALRGTGTAITGRRTLTRQWLLGLQAGLGAVLLIVAGLFSRSLQQVYAIDLGMDVDRTLSIHLADPTNGATVEQRNALIREITRRVQAVPGVRRSALASTSLRAVAARSDTRTLDQFRQTHLDAPYEIAVDSGYFKTLGTRLRGRGFSEADVAGAQRVAILNAPLAHALFLDREAIGACVYLPIRMSDTGPCWRVVGVLDGYWYPNSILNRDGLLAYVPLAQRPSFGPLDAYVSTTRPASEVVPLIRDVLAPYNVAARRIDVRWMHDVVAPELRPWELAATSFSLLGLIAMSIAAIGLYAVVAFVVAQRSGEIAVRLVLGARRRDVLAVVSRDAAQAVSLGSAAGALAALGIRHWTGPMLFATSPGDPIVIVIVLATFLSITAIAIVLPLVKVLRLPIVSSLRAD